MLYVLSRANPKLCSAIMKNADPELIKTISEIALNILAGNNKISNKSRKKLSRYKRQMRRLACSKQSLRSKRKILVQKGGFLPMLIGSILSGIIGALLQKHEQ